MSLWKINEIALTLGVTPLPKDAEITGVSLDTRHLKPGDLFIALKGPRFDGNDYVEEALKKGAAAALCTRPHPGPCLVVGDTDKALWQLGVAARARFQGKILAVTGSVGKTTTKEMLRLVLDAPATEGNLNNHLGAPLTLARLPKDAPFAILELGMNHAGELTELTALAKPHLAIVTTVAPAHLGNFPNIEGIAHAKAEIYSGLMENGVALVPADSPYRVILETSTPRQKIYFGANPDTTAQLVQAHLHPHGQDVTLRWKSETVTTTLASLNPAAAQCALAAFALSCAAGVPPSHVAEKLAYWQPTPGRGGIETVDWQGGQITVMDDSYNASPASVTAALQTLSRLPGRKIAVLGDMLELGHRSPALHRKLAETVTHRPIAKVFTAGLEMKHLHDALPPAQQGAWAATSAALADAVMRELSPGDVILVKGSAGMQMKTVIQHIKNK